MAADHSPTREQVALADVLDRHRAAILARLETLDWAADPADPHQLVAGPEAVRARARLFLALLIGGLRTGDWTRFDETIGRRTADLLGAGIVSAPQLNQRALAIASFLVPAALAEPDPEPLLIELFSTMQSLSGHILAAHHERLLADSRRLDDLKTMFLRMTGHELRGPLGNIRGWTSMLEAGDLGELPAAARGGIRAVDAAAANALGMLDRLAEVARLESGTEALQRSPRRLEEVVNAAVGPLREAARRTGVELRVSARGEASLDMDEMVIAIRNLLGNAIKYAPGSVVEVRAGRQGDEAWVEVADHGPGIPDEELGLVFDRYYRAAGSRGSVTGSGLGLYIVKRIAELHGGEVSVESRPGEGSTFRIRIPAA